ncbi:hypothetical protein JF544_01445 [Halobacillus kuroshimensis]|uniref:Uncharacterized protein n=1 Tax=Halobacillus kuroshimensis TaxID=302481 RepID=A0ABS3DRB0_9BACI|nr:hypothetical protein [Halobacillus kuroshimensis]MBN8233885.1 hypothetical protein [Halobacillus kuroshimensis]
MVEKMRHHKKPKVHFNLLLYLSCCVEGDNEGRLEGDYLYEVLHELSQSSNKNVKGFAMYYLEKLQSRLNG